MDACDEDILSAFVDGELEVHVRDRVAAHLVECARCRLHVTKLRELSAGFAAMKFDDLKPIERARLHREIDARADAPIWRLGGAVGLIAASILVVASTWLAAIPAAKAPAGAPSNSTIASAASDWDQIARTGFVPIGAVDDQIYLADSHLDEWMLDALTADPLNAGALNGSRP